MLRLVLVALACGVGWVRGQFGADVAEFAANLRPLGGASLIASVHEDCKDPFEELGQCLTGQRRPKHRLARKFYSKARKALAKLKEHPDVQALEDIGRDVDQCFESNGCIKPLGSVKCLLDYIIYGGPYDRAAKCMQDSWATELDLAAPEFGDLSSLEKELKLFAGIGLYKRLNSNRTAFWDANRDKLKVFCPQRRVASVQSCIDEAAYSSSPLRLDLSRLADENKIRRQWEACRGQHRSQGRRAVLAECGRAPASSRMALPPALSSVRLSVFGEKDDVDFVKKLLMYTVVGCGVDLVVHPNNLPLEERSSSRRKSMRDILRMFRSPDVCDMPKCIQYLWTVKESLCGECRRSIMPDFDPLNQFRGFARAASEEFIQVVSGGGGDYQCQLKDSQLCEQCQNSALRWGRERIDPLAGYEKEAQVVLSLLKLVCSFGKGREPITATQCSNYL